MAFLYEEMDNLREYGNIDEMPEYIKKNLSSRFDMRLYQKEAFENFITHYKKKRKEEVKPLQVLFHMATGSGKTLIMAGLMIYLYKQGFRNFLFFVNLSNIVKKTKENFLSSTSSKFLFAEEIIIDGKHVRINPVDNFQYTDNEAINICFSTTQGLHSDIWIAKENGLTYDDFEGQKVVFISDEAHHLNADTKKRLSKEEKINSSSWEETVKRIFHSNRENILLEFTATCDIENPEIKKEYEDKIIFNYPLKKFYTDLFSKDIVTLRSNLTIMERALQALVISQYRLKIFQKNNLKIKPVMLFKAAKIEDSLSFMAQFIETVKNLTGAQLQKLAKSCGNDEIMMRAYKYFSENEISFDMLAEELKDDFSEEHCVSVNHDKDMEQKQILLNSLEDEDNPYRAIFEVKKLDEGWDVLNLFDIVRLYETRQSGGKVSPTTVSEAQLIGRGARYCPFQLNDEQEKFKRKYDGDIENEMRVCETLYYHCQNDSRYIDELKRALREIGLDLDKTVQRKLELKENFKKTDIYRNGFIFLNDRKVKNRKDIHNLSQSIRDYPYTYRAFHMGGSDTLLEDSPKIHDDEVVLKTVNTTIGEIAKINYAIVNKALMRFPVFQFDTLKKCFPNISSTREFITDEQYLGKIKIEIQSDSENLSAQTLGDAVFHVLGKISDNGSFSESKITYEGLKDFIKRDIKKVFSDSKTLNYTDPHDGGVGISQNDGSVTSDFKIDLSKEDWFVYSDNFGTSEEKAFVAYFRNHIDELKKTYSEIYLVRNEREACIYSFDSGQRFEPDFVLFLRKNKTKGFEQLQVFIEPKGKHLLEKDKWKEDFLLELEKEAIPVKIFSDDNDYKIWGFHFFNQTERGKDFGEDFRKLLLDK